MSTESEIPDAPTPTRDMSDSTADDLHDILDADKPYITDGMKDEARRALRQAGRLDEDE